MRKTQLLGCVADDFTGASDAASFLQKAGMHTLLMNEVQRDIQIADEVDAIVIAMKTRTEESSAAVRDTLEAVKWLKEAGAAKFYFKYCSTFDSTKAGNIGPVADAIMEYLNQLYTILCPALPVNGRTVLNGRLYVNGIPLEESPMKHHPLTPMWDSRIQNLIEAQSKYTAVELSRSLLSLDSGALREWLYDRGRGREHFYVIPDYENKADSEHIIRLFGDLKFLTGGSGILEALATYMRAQAGSGIDQMEAAARTQEANHRLGVAFAGSCSAATLGQIQDYQERGHITYRVDPAALYRGEQTKKDLVDFVRSHPEDEVLVYSSEQADQVRKAQQLGRDTIAQLIEQTLSGAAAELLAHGYGRIVVAGGETSGAVTKALGYDAFEIGPSVAPGVPIMTPVNNPQLKLVLKSGNFGQPDFFTRALALTKGEDTDE